MELRLQLVEGEYRVVVPAETVEQLNLKVGATVRLTAVPTDSTREHRTMSFEEGMAAFRSTEHLHSKTYRELAK